MLIHQNLLGKLKLDAPDCMSWRSRVMAFMPAALRSTTTKQFDCCTSRRSRFDVGGSLYSLRMIVGGTFQVGVTVMNFIVSVSSGVAFSPGWPTTTRVDHARDP